MDHSPYLSILDHLKSMTDYIVDGQWDLATLRQSLPNQALNEIITYPTTIDRYRVDMPLWKLTSDGVF